MRLALPMTPGELALRLSTTVDVIATLEQGRLRALPHWEETQRVVGGLCALHHVDPHPILHRILEQASTTQFGAPPVRGPGKLHRTGGHPAAPPARPATHAAHPHHAQPPAATRQPERRQPQQQPRPQERAVSRAAPRTEQPAKTGKPRKPWRRPSLSHGPGRVLLAVAGPMVAVAAAVWAVQAQPRALRAAIDVLPAPVSQSMLTGLDALAVRLAPRHDGLRWIEVADPSTRKADKLQVQAGVR